jgi:4-hydroxy-2-oxoheptanedioate aldolase
VSLKLASGIIVPQINTADEAKQIVAHSKFPPQGLRGQGSAFPGFAHNIDIPTYLNTANETIIICVQIESVQGVENVDAICAVEGIGRWLTTLNDGQTVDILPRYALYWTK